MKIGIYDPYLDDLGGGEKYMMTLAQCLSDENSVTVFWDNKDDFKKVAKRFALDVSKIKVEKNIFSPSYSLLRRCLDSFRFDVIIVLSDGSIPFVLSKKLFIHFQQPFPDKKSLFKDVLKKARVNTFFCNSLFTKSYIDKEFGINSKVIYPPVDIDFKNAKKENIILHVGRFRAINLGGGDYKKQGIMLDVFKKMIDGGLKNWKFVFAIGIKDGDQPKLNKLKEEAEGYPIEFLTNLNNEELREMYSKSKIYWHASGYGEDLSKRPEMAEHFGISTVEAMGAGVVPIVINAGGQKEIIEDGKNGYLWNNLEELVQKTNELINDEKTWIQLSKNAKEKFKIFAGERFCREIKSLLK